MASGFSYANATMDNSFSDSLSEHLKAVGRIFYIHSPSATLYEKIDDVPNFFRQVS